MVTPACRPGHSLPELIVAVTFLGATLGAVGATAAAAAGRTHAAVVKQEAVRGAAAILDSLLAAPVVVEGERTRTGTVFRWTTLESGATPRLAVTATGADGRKLVRLEARWLPAVEVLPREEGTPP